MLHAWDEKMQRLEAFVTFLKNRVDLFYVLAFIPLVLVSYFNVFGAIIPTFGFLLLFLKRDELTFYVTTHLVERVLGFSIIFSSFFLYYILVPFIFSSMTFYGSPNYIAYIFGLCLAFFGVSSFKKVFTSLFLMVAASSNPFVSKWLEQYLSSYVVPFFADLVVGILKILGISVTTGSQGVIILQTWNGPLPLAIIWSCVGVTSMFIFSTILVVLLFEDSSNIKTKLLWSFIGIFGTFLVNVIRVTLIFLTDFYLGSEAGGRFHYTAGYILFFAWLAFFFFIFSKRNAILRGIQLIRAWLHAQIHKTSIKTTRTSQMKSAFFRYLKGPCSFNEGRYKKISWIVFVNFSQIWKDMYSHAEKSVRYCLHNRNVNVTKLPQETKRCYASRLKR